MERVTSREVVRHWLEREVEKEAEAGGPDPEALDTTSAVDALLSYKPGAADVVWRDGPVEWYRLDLDRTAFLDLRVVGGPPGLLWRALSPDGTIVGAARRVADEPAETLTAETGVDVETIRSYRDAVADGETLDPLVCGTRAGCAPWYVADGNHRATGRALHLLETDAYEPQPAYLAVSANPVLAPIRERLCGLLRRLVGERPPVR
jgi:hypothetical protein